MINDSNKSNGKKLVVGIGSALVDILALEDDEFIEKSGVVKGGMTLVNDYVIDDTLSMTTNKTSIVPGGSACNTIVGIGKLGGAARFVGKLGEDELGKFFENDLKNNNVESHLFTCSFPTGRVLSIVTPDAQRSMFTCLGASLETKPEEITINCFIGAAVVHIEGYLLFNKDLMLSALNNAKSSGALISLDLASFTVVEENKDFIDKIVDDYVDILLANEDEASAFTGYKDELRAIDDLSKRADIAVLKIGERGSYISHKGEVIKVAPMGNGFALDTTGAGDLWAAGFLFGLVNGYNLKKCGELGSACGYEVCQVVGANIPEDGWDRIKKMLM
ncbi:MAG: adenosine kinase [Proteobacteria bacterium]|nr:adenosine kinase [Pseudomonadota bacterium]